SWPRRRSRDDPRAIPLLRAAPWAVLCRPFGAKQKMGPPRFAPQGVALGCLMPPLRGFSRGPAMIPVPSRRLLLLAAAATLAAFAVVAFPSAWLPLLAADLLLAGAALLDYLLTPRPSQIEAVRLTPDRLSVLSASPVTLVVRNRSGVALQVRLRDS